VYPTAKRAVDVVLAAVAIVVCAVPLVLIAIVNVLTAGRVFASETRVSRGRTFNLLKFASTGRDGELTWLGRTLLRPRYLDELPQLFNILRGDLSFVGPRPWPPPMVARQAADGLDYRNRVIAGLTGPAQVTKGVTGTRYTDLDLQYVDVLARLRGFRLVAYDVRILSRTFRVLARGEGLNY
jgi:lipopolysaccharide/colanic/teichoic acid biosynthesis glycosyltransferase